MNSLFCTTRADEAALAASQTDLHNVKERLLRSEAAWRVMADQLRHIETHRRAMADAKSKPR